MSGFIKATGGIVFLCLIAFLVAIRSVFGGNDDRILIQDDYPVIHVAGGRSGLQDPGGLLFHPEYGLIVCNGATGSLTAFSPSGRRRHIVEPGHGLISPKGVTIGEEGFIVSDAGQGKLLLYSAPGTDPVELCSEALRSPEGLAVDQQNRLYIADEELSVVLRQTGDQREILATSLDGLRTPEEMTLDDQGNLYITDESACAVFKITPDGVFSLFADESDGLHRPEGIVFHEGGLYIIDDLAGMVFLFDEDGNGRDLLTFGRRYRRLSGITFDESGHLYVLARDPFSDNAWLLGIELNRHVLLSAVEHPKAH